MEMQIVIRTAMTTMKRTAGARGLAGSSGYSGWVERAAIDSCVEC
jgi:hypothetical protein